MGDDIPGKTTPNLTDDLLNTNGFAPHSNAGENGNPVHIPTWEVARMQQLYHINKFNLLASDRIPLNRTLPDVRKKKCLDRKYQVDRLPSTSVIIVFHNEAWSTLLRTVHSVITRSPPSLLEEILLVDDASQRTFLKEPLDEYVAKLPVSVRVIRSSVRTGLIRARLLGAQEARGAVLTFLDAHCEATTGWLEPLLSRIAEDRTRVVCPIIDIVHEDTFQYVRSFELHWGAFNWNLHFRWYTLGQKELEERRKDITEAYSSCGNFGTALKCDDHGGDAGDYGGDQDDHGGTQVTMEGTKMTMEETKMTKEKIKMTMERLTVEGTQMTMEGTQMTMEGTQMKCISTHSLSPRCFNHLYIRRFKVCNDYCLASSSPPQVWMCGGSVEIAPCSHVGHVFRKSSPYTFPGEGGVGGVLYRNLARVALVWLDDWAEFYFKINSEAARVRDDVTVRDRLMLRDRLNCRDFRWYLENIWPEHFFPMKDTFFGKIRHQQQGRCLQRPMGKGGGSNQPTGPAVLRECVIETYPPQSFVFNKKGYIMTDESVCLDAPDADAAKEPQVRIMACNEFDRQRWTYDESTHLLKHIQSGMCLDLPSKSNPETLSLQTCDSYSKSQKWIFQHEDWSKML
ncbi:polypeptide N-acetylgalactosaminyltransferase 1-like [Panulirus ornatus]|uniref:polypeptide N-acetylgalactosaminyltransferase 1-like n=1 Tax=Panulirus ornatus TaxID=150431 RepID=UPI003A85B279